MPTDVTAGAAVREPRDRDRVTAGEPYRTGVNETTVVALQPTGSCRRGDLNRSPISSAAPRNRGWVS